MKTRLLAAVLAVAALFGAASAKAGDGNTTSGNVQGEALEVFALPMSTVGVTMCVSSSGTAIVTSVTLGATVYWVEVFVLRDLATGAVIDSTTGFLIAAWSGTWTGGEAFTPLTQWVNFARGVPFGLYGADKVGADDELQRFGPYREGMNGTPIRMVWPVLHIITPQVLTAGLNSARVIIRYGTRPYGVNPDVRGRRGSASAPVDDGVREFIVSVPAGRALSALIGGGS